MRIENLYILYDKKAKAIVGNIVHATSPVPILREITEAANKPGLVGNNPEDFAIYLIGAIDQDTGKLVDGFEDQILLEENSLIAEVASLVKKE